MIMIQPDGLPPLPHINDPDPIIQCDLMDGRDAFLTLARERHYEFSSLRRTNYSTLALLYELHNQGHDKFIYTCNNCNRHVETRYHCNNCEVSIFTQIFLHYLLLFLHASSLYVIL